MILPIVNAVKESARLGATHRYLDFNIDREKELNELVMLASQICETPISLITLMDQDVQWIKAKMGADISEMPRKTSFCTHAIENDDIMIVEDATLDKRFLDIPVVANTPHIRFYASANLRSHDGYNVGTLCVYDVKPKSLTVEQQTSLTALANQVSHVMELDFALKTMKKQNITLSEIARIQSHELRLPVSSILGIMDLINEEVSDLNPEYLDLLNQSVNLLDEKIRIIVNHANSDYS
ncbi:MAG: GAF domain-containing protein [Pyrinomonadaceae bacterium]|nr:GAF domain-containing protein [Sphingobacteriaceae bacterium]